MSPGIEAYDVFITIFPSAFHAIWTINNLNFSKYDLFS